MRLNTISSIEKIWHLSKGSQALLLNKNNDKDRICLTIQHLSWGYEIETRNEHDKSHVLDTYRVYFQIDGYGEDDILEIIRENIIKRVYGLDSNVYLCMKYLNKIWYLPVGSQDQLLKEKEDRERLLVVYHQTWGYGITTIKEDEMVDLTRKEF